MCKTVCNTAEREEVRSSHWLWLMSAEQWIGYLTQARLTISKMSSDEGGQEKPKSADRWKWRNDVSQGSHCEVSV
ncbi:hypothetical protein SKAU_G00256860 [Synaphobranchus kaupii]|uniref:Uncharacterized protein n=1 Tax=Synaphobranchus kaupii TaxID=118154 RepID=A0A9Q1IRI1_SYNKA|nr:hypothetical protein SKAU_G00256860 [Synaphobranchus kaupii]